ncbi:preprotein translocase subunit SecE [Mobilisporobacter senegalensis]|uniref:Protein translocase subunit SecE n=1 Tax=Mobilisporobacter senegalensis TaxID=1329262 RepID=A0A3N1XZX6_9FIRM|nr:preprotein translocase subunit SecE [Mobilisporobacter senegalensis]ROR31801.1 preprotein translocase subunit SecE [Mobilisporobacter senegalensis]
MGETANTTEKAPKKSWFKGLKSEFKKIAWPDRESLTKQTVAVIAVSVALGIIIAIIDYIVQFGVKFLIG